jgi:3-oxoacyl-[acyl-carrier protein] reductase
VDITYPDLSGRVALVTGGSRALGAQTCRTLAASGVKVAVGGRDEAAVAEVVRQIRDGGGTATAAIADATDAGALRDVAGRIASELGPITVLAAFVGGGGRPTPSRELTEDHWRSLLDTNLTSTFLTISAVLPQMAEAGGGAIVTMSSSAGREPGQANLGYAVAKAGVVMMTRQLAAELAPQHVRVNCLAPASVVNERMSAHLSAEQLEGLGAQFPLGRLGRPADVAAATAFLASDAASWITGVTLDLTGGRYIS